MEMIVDVNAVSFDREPKITLLFFSGQHMVCHFYRAAIHYAWDIIHHAQVYCITPMMKSLC